LFATFAEFKRNQTLERLASIREAIRVWPIVWRSEKFTDQELQLIKILINSRTPIKMIAER